MSTQPPFRLPAAFAGLALVFSAAPLLARPPQAGAALPATAPTSSLTAPLAATPGASAHSTGHAHAAHVSCANGLLTVQAENSSLNQILRSIAGCTGMRITGGIAEQRVYGNYGPAAPSTVIATLIDGTGSNMLLKETAADRPAELILTPRIGGPTPPPPSSYNEAEDTAPATAAPLPNPSAGPPQTQPFGPRRFNRPPLGATPAGGASSQTPVPQPTNGSVVNSPPAVPQPINNVNGSPSNTSPTVGNYPTTNSVPLDSVATPATTPPANGIVDSPNPPPAGSDTAAALNGSPRGTPGTTNISPDATSDTSTPGATNTTVPVEGATPNTGQPSSDLTPEQVFQQLQQQQPPASSSPQTDPDHN